MTKRGRSSGTPVYSRMNAAVMFGGINSKHSAVFGSEDLNVRVGPLQDARNDSNNMSGYSENRAFPDDGPTYCGAQAAKNRITSIRPRCIRGLPVTRAAMSGQR